MRLLTVRLATCCLCLIVASCGSRTSEKSRVTIDQPLPPSEREPIVLKELNEMRANPAAYAAHVEARLPYYEKNVLRLPGLQPIRTTEGKAAAEEAIAALKRSKPLPPLEPAYGLALAARDHARDIGPKGLVSHEGSGGTTTLEQRVSRYATRYDYIGENISFGPERPRDVVLDLLIDDNVPDRGHRKLLLDPKFRFVGIACGNHAIYRTMCVIDLAANYVDKS